MVYAYIFFDKFLEDQSTLLSSLGCTPKPAITEIIVDNKNISSNKTVMRKNDVIVSIDILYLYSHSMERNSER